MKCSLCELKDSDYDAFGCVTIWVGYVLRSLVENILIIKN